MNRPSRRDVLLGRLLGRVTLESSSRDCLDAAHVPVPLAPVLRYPKSLEDVAAADPPATSGTTGAPAARRRVIPIFRPPGAVDEPTFLRECTRCEDCITACPHDAIVLAGPRFREAAGTPTIEADTQPCLMCKDFPCIASCEPGVLRFDQPKVMGTAFIKEQLCIAYHGQVCTACHDECPVDGAIALADGKPTVSEDHCTGCGVCRHVCPAPNNAVVLMPTFIRVRTNSPQPQSGREPNP